MPRIGRVVAVDVPHHVTQRGNNRQPVFLNDSDRRSYCKLLAEWPDGAGRGQSPGFASRGRAIATKI